MKKLTAILLLATMMFSASACGSTPETTPADTTAAKPDEDKPSVISVDKDYKVVIPTAATEEEKAAAELVVASLKKVGITVGTVTDATAPADKEILIGKTSRDESTSLLDGLGNGDFKLATRDAKIILAAIDPDGVTLAAGYFIHTYVQGKTEVALDPALSFSHKKGSVTLNGTPLSDYTLYYAAEGTGSDKDVQAAKYQDTAQVFLDLLEKATGVRLESAADSPALATKNNVILLGRVSHTDVVKLYNSKLTKGGVGAYAAQLTAKNNLVLAGVNPCSALAAGEAAVYSMLGENKEIASLNLSGTKDILRVACVGDSITYGTNSTDPSMQSYPVYLQRMLGYGYYVEKYGAPSHSLIETDTSSFLKHGYFKQSVNTAPDVVIVMLGTNDCRTQKWQDSAYKDWTKPARKEAFLAAGQKLIDAYREKNADVQIIFTTCPTVPQDAWLGTDWTQRIMAYGNPAIKEIAEKNYCPVIDIFSYSRKHPEMFEGGDGLHPQNEQYEILAKGVYDLSKDIIKK